MGQEGTARVFGTNGFDVTYTLDDPGRPSQILGREPAQRASLQLATPAARIKLLGEEVTFKAAVDAAAIVHERGWAIDAFEDAPIAGPETGRMAELRLEADLAPGTEATPIRSPWSLSLRAAGQARFATRHLLQVAEASTLGDAFHDLRRSAQWPFSVRLDSLAEGELHTLEANLGLEFGLTLSCGFERDVKWTLVDAFEDTPIALKAHLEGLVKAAVGAGLQEELVLAVGRLTANPGWVRIRLRRRQERRLTFGATLALQVHYDLGSSLVAVLDRALDLLPLYRLMGSLSEVARALASGGEDWPQQVSAAAARRVGELIDDEGWLDTYASDPRVRRLVSDLATLADTWEQLDDTVTSFWAHFLSSATGGRTATIRAALEIIAALGPEGGSLDDLLKDRHRQTIDLVETFSGHSLEELLSGSWEELQAHLAEAGRLAKDALRLLDLDQEVLAALHAHAERTGIEACVAWIAANATSVKKLRTLATTTIEGLVERLLGKALAEISAADVQKLQRWATHVSQLLDEREAWEQALRAEMERLQGDLGCSVGLEVGRLLRQSALIDLEIDPADSRVRKAVQRALAAADIRALLEALPDEPAEPGQASSPPPFLLRECAFASRRERWTTGSWLLGSSTGEARRRRIVESAVRVTQTPPSGQDALRGFTRRATYAGGFVRGVNGSAAVTFDAGVWLDLVAIGPGTRLAAPYDTVARTLRLTVLRHDLATSTSQGEPSAMVRLLADLGFVATDEDARALPNLDGQETSLALRISLPHDALDALVEAAANEDTWSTAYLNAGFRWLEPGLEENEANDLRSNRGALCRTLILTPAFQANWTRWADVDRWAPALPAVRRVAGKPFKHGRWQRDFIPLGGKVGAAGGPGVDGLISWRPWSMARLRDLAQAAPATATRPDDLLVACDRFAALFAATPGVWEEPLFGLWLVLALLVQSKPGALAGATGLATLRWRPRKADPWQGPAVWRLPKNGLHVPDDPHHRRIFPL